MGFPGGCVGPAILAVLSATTFWTFVREFSPLGLHAGRVCRSSDSCATPDCS